MNFLYTRRIITLLPALVLLLSVGNAQIFRMGNTSIESCSGFFVDSGGDEQPYGANENFQMTICSNGEAGSHIRLNFTSVELRDGDELCFYDGEDTSAPQVACAVDFEPGHPFIIQANIQNRSGCITVTFNSNGSGEASGWSAQIECVPACQTITAELVSSNPAVEPADTGWIDACAGQRLFFEGRGLFPQEGAVYSHQNSSSYIWDFGDGTVTYGPEVDHIYEKSGGYIIQLTIVDQFNCRNTNFISQRVRIATRPKFEMTEDIPTEICAQDTIQLSASINEAPPSGILSVTSTEGSFQAAAIRSDSLPLPDGTGARYETSVQFSEFSPGQRLERVDDLEAICVNIEHSWMRDLEISLTCPSGEKVILHNHPGRTGGVVFLGEPIDGDNIPIPGVGYDYCWTPDATAGTWIQYANRYNPGTLPAGDYNSFEPLDNLVGCPLNGEWTITVVDLWQVDNGFIFSWGINFNPDIYPELEKFTPDIVAGQWLPNSSYIFQAPDSIAASPQNAGTAAYTFRATDEYGCMHDTTITYNVLPLTHPDCHSCVNNLIPLRDTALCGTGTVALNAGPTSVEEVVGFETFPNYDRLGNALHPAATPYETGIVISSIQPTRIEDPLRDIVSVCIDIETAPSDWVADLTVFLVAPSGERLELTSGNGANGSHYTNTCFSPTATNSIRSGTAPFTGTFSPEGNWNVLRGATINGEWRLLVSDSGGPAFFGTFLHWSITFNNQNTIEYSWNNTADLSCTNCPNPIITPSGFSTYIVEATDNYNCTFSDTVTIASVEDIPAPIVTCGLTAEGVVTFNWEELPGISEYEININGLGWTTSNNGPLSHMVSGLAVNEEVSIQVRALTGASIDCPVAIGTASCFNDVCVFSAQLAGEPTDISCFAATDGSVRIDVANGRAPFSYLLDSVSVFSTNVINNIAAGDHAVYVSDADGCADVVYFTIEEPAPIEITADIIDATCSGGSNGSITVQSSGGTGTMSYNWSNNAIGNTLTNVAAGNYTLRVSDENNCQVDSILTVGEPDAIVIELNTVAAFCNNSEDGEVTATVIGGTGDITYVWNTGATTSSISGLSPGAYTVTVVDANGCQAVQSTEIIAPNSLEIVSIRQQPASCFGSNDGMAMVEVRGGTPTYTYRWNDPTQQVSSTALLLEAGLYEVVVTDANGCEVVGGIEVLQPDELAVSIETTAVNCYQGKDGTANAIISGGTMPYSYMWSDSSAQRTALAQGLSAGTYIVTVTDANGCQSTRPTMITQPNTPVIAQIQQTYRGCFGMRTNRAEATAIGGTGPDYTFRWNDGQTKAIAENLDTVLYRVTVTDSNGCTSEASILINDLDSIRLNIAFVPPTCNGAADGQISVNYLGGGTGNNVQYRWNTVPERTTAFINNLTGDRTYRVTTTDSEGCMQSKELYLEQPRPIMLITDSTDVSCHGGEDGIARIMRAIGQDTVFTYLWDEQARSQTDRAATGLRAGNYSVTVTSGKGCQASTTIEVKQPEPLKTTFATVHNKCYGDAEGSITTTINGGVGGYIFNWSTGDSTRVISNLRSGTYMLTVEDANQCQLFETVTLTQPDLITATFTQDSISCFGGRDGSFTVQPQGGTPPFQYSLEDTKHFSSNNRFIGLKSGEYAVFVKDANGCSYFETTYLPDPPEFIVNVFPFQDFLEMNYGDTMILWANSQNGVGKTQWNWSSDQGDSTWVCESNLCTGIVIYPTSTTYYQLHAIDEKGCESRDRIQIRVLKHNEVLVPTGFSPNSDGVNDLLHVHGSPGVKITMFRIYDRLGELLYESADFMVNDRTLGWDGTFRGKDMPPGVYVWYAEAEYADGMKEIFKGSTTLLR